MDKENCFRDSPNCVNVLKERKITGSESIQKCTTDSQTSLSKLRKPYNPMEYAVSPAVEYDDHYFNKENAFTTVNQVKKNSEVINEQSEKCMFNNSLSFSNVDESYVKSLPRHKREDGNIIDPELDPKNIQLVTSIPFKLKKTHYQDEDDSTEEDIEKEYEPVTNEFEKVKNSAENSYQLRPISVKIRSKRCKSKPVKAITVKSNYSHIKSKVAQDIKGRVISKSEIRLLNK